MKKIRLMSMALACLVAVSAFGYTGENMKKNSKVTAEESTDNWVLTWSDEFEGDTLDMTKWTYDIGNWKLDEKGNYETAGWGNNEQEFYTDKNTVISDGTLKIQAKKENYTDPVQGTYEYTSSKLITQNKFSVCYGKIDIRARVDSGKSLWPALWMLPEDSVYGKWAASGEIDIMEGWGSTPEKICGTIHFGDTWPGNTYLTNEYHFENGDSTENWHVYSIEWEEGEIRWYVDGELYSTQNAWSSNGRDFPAPFDQNFYLILNLAVGGHFDGVDGIHADPSIFADGPKELEVDYVRVYQKDGITHTPSAPSQVAMKGYFMEGGQGLLSNTDSGTTVSISEVGTQQYSAMATLENIDVKKGKTYELDFDVISTAKRPMIVTAENAVYDRFLEKEVTVNGTNTHYHYECTFENDEKIDLKFQLGNIGDASAVGAHDVVISNLKWTDPDAPVTEPPVTQKPVNTQTPLKSYFMEGGNGVLLNSFEGTTMNIAEVGTQTYSAMAALENISVKKDAKYTLDFDIYSDKDRAVNVTVENSVYDRYFDKTLSLTGEAVHYHYDCTFEKDDIVDVKFLLGNIENASSLGAHKVVISNLKWSEEKTEPLVTTITSATEDTTVSDKADTYKTGDLNGDGSTDLTDLTNLSLYLLGDKKFDDVQKKLADVNADTIVDIADLAHYKQYVSKDNVVLGK